MFEKYLNVMRVQGLQKFYLDKDLHFSNKTNWIRLIRKLIIQSTFVEFLTQNWKRLEDAAFDYQLRH